MLTIDRIETNSLSGMTDLVMTYHLLGKADKHQISKAFLTRHSAVWQVRASVDQYFKNNIERFIRTIHHIDDLCKSEKMTESKRRSLTIIEKYHEYLFKDECNWPDPLSFYLRIQGDFRKLLPSRKNYYYPMLDNQVKEFERLAEEFLTEFVQEGDQLMAKYQPQAQAS